MPALSRQVAEAAEAAVAEIRRQHPRIAGELRTALGPQAYVDAYTHGLGLGRVEALALVEGHLSASRGAAAGRGT